MSCVALAATPKAQSAKGFFLLHGYGPAPTLPVLRHMSDDLSPRLFERRQPTRLSSPPCPKCGTSTEVSAVLRTVQVVYFRCAACGSLVSMDKPHNAFN